MKNLFIISILAVAGILLSGCALEEVPSSEGSILAIMENDETRTSVTDEGKFTWSADDQVWLETTSGSVLGTLSTGAGTANATSARPFMPVLDHASLMSTPFPQPPTLPH